MKFASAVGVAVLAVVAGEAFSAWWMGGGRASEDLPVLEWDRPYGKEWSILTEEYDEVDEVLKCDSGWVGEIESGGRPVRFSFFRWDQNRTANTLEVFHHQPEVCMGSIGMKLKKRFDSRVMEVEGRPIRFDVTSFEPGDGLGLLYIFKAIVVSGHEQASLRSGFDGFSLAEWRRFRLGVVWKRFRPPHARVLMGGISGMPTEELAWREFRSLVQPRLRWTTHGELTSEGEGGRS
jgi:hypothetical protein